MLPVVIVSRLAIIETHPIMLHLDAGAYGVVLKCRDKDSNEFVAIKKFKETEGLLCRLRNLRRLLALAIQL